MTHKSSCVDYSSTRSVVWLGKTIWQKVETRSESASRNERPRESRGFCLQPISHALSNRCVDDIDVFSNESYLNIKSPIDDDRFWFIGRKPHRMGRDEHGTLITENAAMCSEPEEVFIELANIKSLSRGIDTTGILTGSSSGLCHSI